MCGRYSLSATPDVIAEIFGVSHVPALTPRYNVAPTQDVAVVRAEKDGGRRLDLLHWGLVPSWADDPAIGNRMINARAETLTEKPSFRNAFKSRRCLVVADGFYEWKRKGKTKIPYLIRRPDGGPFAFAGLWEHWHRGPQALDSCAIITTSPNELMTSIHDRMPVVLDHEAYDYWLDPSATVEELGELLAPAPEGELVAFPVSKRVNSPSNDDASLQASDWDDTCEPGAGEGAE